MNDMEKVIKGLECCSAGCTFGCPYGDEPAHCTDSLTKDALELLKAQEPCMDAVSREAVLDLAQTYGPATYDMPYGSGDMIIRPEDVKTLPSVQPIPLARVMTLEEIPYAVFGWMEMFGQIIPCVFEDVFADDTVGFASIDDGHDYMDASDYGKTWRVWTSQPTAEQMEAIPWN